MLLDARPGPVHATGSRVAKLVLRPGSIGALVAQAPPRLAAGALRVIGKQSYEPLRFAWRCLKHLISFFFNIISYDYYHNNDIFGNLCAWQLLGGTP